MNDATHPPSNRPPNRLANETSPYLLQHSHNPVDWYPWGPEALQRARAENTPILLSVGYSACHWCHVMERESFEDEAVAAHMNAGFVNIKVDREERPDLDEIYMRAVQAFTGGRGGWPMTVFLTPEGAPFFGGTYFPPRRTGGMPAFTEVLAHVERLWKERGEDVAETTAEIARYLQESGRAPRAGEAPSDWLAPIVEACASDFDEAHAGFGGAPKFPPHGALAALLAQSARTGDAHARELATRTLDAMAKGGMYDLLGGGFARYSVDTEWRVPHFEKMLYDNAQLVPVYVDAWLQTRDPHYRRVVEETLGWILREMTNAEGGFLSALDADSEGVEGKFYAWTPTQLSDVLGATDGPRAAALLGVTPEGTFEHGSSVLRLEVPLERMDPADAELLRTALPKLFTARSARVPPGRDDKVITSWNALTISAFARAAAAFDVPEWRGAAVRGARFLLDRLVVEGRLMRTYKDGRAHVPAFADDHAFLVDALIELYSCTLDLDWLREANAWADRTVALFGDPDGGGLWYTGHDAEALITRSKNLLGGAEPSANGVAARAFARLAVLCGRDDLGAEADRILGCYAPYLARAPRALGVEAIAGTWRTDPPRQIGIVGGHAETLLDVIRGEPLPFAVLAWLPEPIAETLLPWMDGKTAVGGHATAYVCEGYSCKAPTTDADALRAQLRGASARASRLGGDTLRLRAPPLPADPSDWLGTDAPLPLDRLRGQVVVLDFWTYCCINCMHVLPELDAIERRFAGAPVAVIGVHSAKFPAEKERHNVERAMRRHRIHHPVVLDPEHRVWEAYTISSWPTVVVLDAQGRIAWQKPGEVTRDELGRVVERLLEEARVDGILAERPAWSGPTPGARSHGLCHPGKISVWPDAQAQAEGADAFGPDARVYVSDTGNHRILACRITRGADGWPVLTEERIYGDGPGLVDGHRPRFLEPQGTARSGDTLWIADTGNHALRALDVTTGDVRTVAGTGRLGRGGGHDGSRPRTAPLRSPWDVAVTTTDRQTEAVFVAMAGSHQLWVYLPGGGQCGPLVGSGREDHVDGGPSEAALAQPSGLSILGRNLFFADSETSSVRTFDLHARRVMTVCGAGLFDFGDVDGGPDVARLQHPLGIVATRDGLFVADTFNGKIKGIDLRTSEVSTLAEGLCEPGGVAVAGDFLLVADTEAHRIAAVHRKTGEVRGVSLG